MNCPFKIGDLVIVAKFGPKSEFTNHGNRKIGEVFKVKRIETSSCSDTFDVDFYIIGKDGHGISNRDLKFAKINNWKEVIENANL